MKSVDILLYGYGGHGKVIAECLVELGVTCIGVFDDDVVADSTHIQYLGKYDEKLLPKIPIIIAIGNNKSRKQIAKSVQHPFYTLIHPSAQIAKSVVVGEGTVILQNVVIQSNTSIGKHSIINMGVMIDHDCAIKDFAHIYPLSYIGSHSKISLCALVEAGTVLKRFSEV